MPIIAVMNRKGGSGKSTLATQIAAWYASRETSVMLGDSDRQRSASNWLSRRSKSAVGIASWPNDLGRVHRSPLGADNVVVDTPGGIHGLELAKQLARIDAIVVPVGPSVFDLETSIDFVQELRQHPRVVSGRCQLAVVGMRWPMDVMQAWENHALPRPLPLLTVIAEAPIYRLCMESGSSIFDAPPLTHSSELPQWQPLLKWLERLPKSTSTAQMSVAPLPVQSTTVARSSPTRSPLPTSTTHSQAGKHVTNKRQLRSPESFVETRPPEGISSAELLAVQFQTRKQVALEMGMATAPRTRSGQMHPESETSERGWLTRLFRAR